MINTFRDSLVITHFDNYRSILDELKAIKKDLETKKRRVTPPIGTCTAYYLIQQVCLPLTRVFKSNKYSFECSIEMFTEGLQNLGFAIQKMVDCERDDLVKSFQHIYNRLFNLLPQNTVIQHKLFNTERYENESKKPAKTRSFLKWLQEYKAAGKIRRDSRRKLIVREKSDRDLKDIVQVSLQLRFG